MTIKSGVSVCACVFSSIANVNDQVGCCADGHRVAGSTDPPLLCGL